MNTLKIFKSQFETLFRFTAAGAALFFASSHLYAEVPQATPAEANRFAVRFEYLAGRADLLQSRIDHLSDKIRLQSGDLQRLHANYRPYTQGSGSTAYKINGLEIQIRQTATSIDQLKADLKTTRTNMQSAAERIFAADKLGGMSETNRQARAAFTAAQNHVDSRPNRITRDTTQKQAAALRSYALAETYNIPSNASPEIKERAIHQRRLIEGLDMGKWENSSLKKIRERVEAEQARDKKNQTENPNKRFAKPGPNAPRNSQQAMQQFKELQLREGDKLRLTNIRGAQVFGEYVLEHRGRILVKVEVPESVKGLRQGEYKWVRVKQLAQATALRPGTEWNNRSATRIKAETFFKMPDRTLIQLARTNNLRKATGWKPLTASQGSAMSHALKGTSAAGW